MTRTTGELIVALRSATLRRYPEYDVDSAAARRALAIEADQPFADLEHERVLADRAVILVWRTCTRFIDDAQRALVELAPDDADALRWVAEQLAELAPSFDATLELRLDAAHQALLPLLGDAHLAPRLTLLHGAPRDALLGLGQTREIPPSLRIAPLQHERHFEAIATMLRDAFRESPALGFLSPGVVVTPEIQERLDTFTHARLLRMRDEGTSFVVLRGDDVVGEGGFDLRDDALLGTVGGLSICLAPDVRGHGIGQAIYARLFERMLACDVRVIVGRTANPAILHLAKRMQREVRGWQLEPVV